MRARSFIAALEHPVQRLVRRNLRPALLQRRAHGGEIVIADGLETGEHQRRWIGVQRQVFAAGVQAPAPMEDALSVGREIHRGDGGEQGLQGGGVFVGVSLSVLGTAFCNEIAMARIG